MQIDSGEYLIISSCIKSPYDPNKIKTLIQEIKGKFKDIIFGHANMLIIDPKKVDYNLIWEGIEDFSPSFSEDLLNQFVLSTLELSFNNGISARLQVMFLDNLSYEVSLIFNYSHLIDEENDIHVRNKRLEFVEEIAIVCFENLDPLYGIYGIERGVDGIEYLLEDTLGLPYDKVFYTKKLINESNTLQKLIKGAKYSKENNKGVYFRYSDTNDFLFVEIHELGIKIKNELLRSL